MATVNVNGLDLNVVRFRSGPPGDRPIIVCLHGLGVVDHSSMAFTVGMPLASTAEVVLYDLRGHGRSQFAPSGYRTTDHVSDLLGLLDALGIDRPVHLLAGSFGGAIGVTATLQHPERVGSLILIDGHFPRPGWGQLFADELAPMLQKLRDGNVSDEDALEEFMARTGLTSRRRAKATFERSKKLLDTTLIDDLRSEPEPTRDDYAAITCPVMALYGSKSPINFLGWELQSLVPKAEVHTIPGADHFTIFYHKGARELIREFVDRAEAALQAGDDDGARPGEGAP